MRNLSFVLFCAAKTREYNAVHLCGLTVGEWSYSLLGISHWVGRKVILEFMFFQVLIVDLSNDRV